jgi:hypothetical protein
VKEPAMHLRIMTMKAAEAPAVFGDSVLFTLDGPARFAGIAFDFEGYAVIHPMMKRAVAAPGQAYDPGLFFYSLDIPLETREIGYRFVVDGLWMPDPANKARRTDPRSGLPVSVAAVPYASRLSPGRYDPAGDDGVARFVYFGAAGLEVCVAGDFNGWDPYLHELRETSPGVYELSIALPPGRHAYCFYVGGQRVADPLNPDRLVDSSGRPLSSLTLP